MSEMIAMHGSVTKGYTNGYPAPDPLSS